MNRQLRARLLLEEAHVLGVDLAALVAAATGGPTLVTVAEWIAEIAPTFGPSTAATYRPYWRLAARLVGDHRLAELTTTDLAAVVDAAAERARAHRPDSTGRSSRETCVAALRALYARAVDAGHMRTNPAAALSKPTRTRGRRQGALNLRIRDIDTERATVWLREKNDTEREQPASPSLVSLLLGHVADRGGGHDDEAIFRNRRGEPVTGRRYDRLFSRARECLGWDDRTPVSAHVLRHTAITRIGRIAGYPVAQAFAGHTPPTVTGRYLHASLADIAAAVSALTGEPHPLDDQSHRHSRLSCSSPSRPWPE